MIENAVTFVHNKLKEILTLEDITIDATMGNGFDTLFLAQHSKFVYSFDIQKQALQNTKSLCDDNNISNVSLILDGHQNINNYIKKPVKAVTFNLGYLPGGDKSVKTVLDSTMSALKQSINSLDKKGLIAITVYIGHEGGQAESDALLTYLKTLDKSHFMVLKYEFFNRTNAPYVLLIEKTK